MFNKKKKKRAKAANSHGHNHDHNHAPVRTIDLINQYIQSKLPVRKEPAIDPNVSMLTGASAQINYLAIVLDGNVEEVMRAQNRLAALLLSSPEFVEFDPNVQKVSIGYKFEDGKFIKNEADEDQADHNHDHSHDHNHNH